MMRHFTLFALLFVTGGLLQLVALGFALWRKSALSRPLFSGQAVGRPNGPGVVSALFGTGCACVLGAAFVDHDVTLMASQGILLWLTWCGVFGGRA